MYIHTTAFAESAAVTVKELLRIYHIQIAFAADISDFCKRFFSRNIPVWQADPLSVAAATEPAWGTVYCRTRLRNASSSGSERELLKITFRKKYLSFSL